MEDPSALKSGGIASGQSTVVMAGGKEVALFNVGGKLYGIGNRCPHRSGPLFRGKVETVSGTLAVRCPIHGWLFELETGHCLTRPGASVPVFPLTCENGQVCVGKVPPI